MCFDLLKQLSLAFQFKFIKQCDLPACHCFRLNFFLQLFFDQVLCYELILYHSYECEQPIYLIAEDAVQIFFNLIVVANVEFVLQVVLHLISLLSVEVCLCLKLRFHEL